MIVTDGELRKLIERPNDPLLADYDPPTEWDHKDSLVQPCSLDLHVGAVFQPGVKPGKVGSAENPRSELVLKTGQTAIVVTREKIHLPADHAGYGFPPAHVSSRALLMTNPGHIDPGYSGKLQFTVINMGREDYVLRSKDLIVTILIFKLATKVNADYAARRAKPAVDAPTDVQKPANGIANLIYRLATKVSAHYAPRHINAGMVVEQADIDRLSPDFVDVQKRATSIARKTLSYATAFAAVGAIILGWAFNAIDKRIEGIDAMKTQLIRVENANSGLAKEIQTRRSKLRRNN